MAKVQEKKYKVKVKENPRFVGYGPGGTQFANGEAEVGERMAAWFKEHAGYEVTEIKSPEIKPSVQ